MPKRGKRYLEAIKLVNRETLYTPEDAIELVKKTSTVKFNATVEAHLRMGLDPRKADQLVRSTVQLPHGTGKEVRVLVFAEGDGQKAALDAGADFAGGDDMVQKIQGGWFEFDVAVATPGMMSKVGRLGRLLGPRGLMPSPKAGTVVQDDDITRVVRELKAGRVEFRLDRTGNIHVLVGKTGFTNQHLLNNLAAVMEAVIHAKPSGAKGIYIRRLTLNATMGPGVKVDEAKASQMKVA